MERKGIYQRKGIRRGSYKISDVLENENYAKIIMLLALEVPPYVIKKFENSQTLANIRYPKLLEIGLIAKTGKVKQSSYKPYIFKWDVLIKNIANFIIKDTEQIRENFNDILGEWYSEYNKEFGKFNEQLSISYKVGKIDKSALEYLNDLGKQIEEIKDELDWRLHLQKTLINEVNDFFLDLKEDRSKSLTLLLKSYFIQELNLKYGIFPFKGLKIVGMNKILNRNKSLRKGINDELRELFTVMGHTGTLYPTDSIRIIPNFEPSEEHKNVLAILTDEKFRKLMRDYARHCKMSLEATMLIRPKRQNEEHKREKEKFIKELEDLAKRKEESERRWNEFWEKQRKESEENKKDWEKIEKDLRELDNNKEDMKKA